MSRSTTCRKGGRLAVAVILAVLLYWIFEAAVEAYLFQQGTLWHRIFSPGAHELYMRLLTAAVVALATGLLFILRIRTETETALRDAESRFSSLLQTASDAVIMSDATGAVLTWNGGAERIFGYRPDEVIGRPMTMLMPLRHQHDHLRGMERVIATGKSQYLGQILDFHGIRKDGTEFPIELCVNYWVAPAGVYFLGIIRDISERRRAEEALEEQRRFAESLVQNSAVATFVISADHRILLWNRACEMLTGIPAADMIGTNDQWKPFYPERRPTLADMIAADRCDELSNLYDEVRSSPLVEGGLQAESFFANLNGQSRHIVFDAAPIVDNKGRLAYVIETLLDISEVKMLEREIEEGRERLQAIIESEPHCVKLIKADGTVIQMNQAGLNLIEADSFELIKGRIMFDLIAPEYKDRFEEHVQRVFRGASETLEFEIMGIKGTRRLLWTHSVPFRDRNGQIIALLGISRDISEQRKLEEQLRHSQKMEAIGQLAGGVAHDFNNILSAIIGYATMADHQLQADDPLRYNMQMILESSQRAAHLTQSLLAFGRKQVVHLKPTDLNGLLRRFETFLKRLIPEDIVLTVRCPEDPLTILADAGQIEQVLMNLATNGRDAMPDGGMLTIECSRMTLDASFVKAHGYGTPGHYAVVSVTDTGVGMDAKTREHIFEPFFTTKEQGKGTGLGLAMAHGIVQKHGGVINVYSEEGKGSTFRVYLPLTQAAAAAEEYRNAKSPVKGGTETILVAEDDDGLRKLARTVLEHFGYTMIEAVDGEDAVLKFRENRDRIGLIILDGIMPKLSGRGAYEAIRAMQPEIKVIFMSGYTEDMVSKKTVIDAGAAFLLKPVAPDDLLRKIREVLDSVTDAV